MKRILLATLICSSLCQIVSAKPYIFSEQVCVGSDAGFFINNFPDYYYGYTFTWQLSTDGGLSWNTLTDNATYNYTASTSMEVRNVSVTMDRYMYRVIATSSTTVDTSDMATLLVSSTPPSTPVFDNPVTNVCQGFSYRYNLVGGLLGDSITISGCCSNVYSYPGLSYNDSSADVIFNTVGTSSLTAYVRNGCGSATSQTLNITVNPPQSAPAGSAGAGSTCSTIYPVPYPASTATDGSCSPIVIINPFGTAAVSGPVQSCVTVDASVQTYNGIPYVQRHYNIEPQNNPSTATATLTFYYTQSDFDAYNAVRGSNPALPTGASDAAGIANLRITQFHGTGTTPGTYTGTTGEIDPADNNIVWNATASRWEVTFSVTGFSGFFVSTGSITPLPLTLTGFTGQSTSGGNLLQWSTAQEQNTAYFDIQSNATASSSTSSAFSDIAKVPAAGNSHLPLHYQYTDAASSYGPVSYRLKMVDLDGSATYSRIITLGDPDPHAFSIQVSPNPVHNAGSLTVTAPAATSAILLTTDISGRPLQQQRLALAKGINTFPVRPLPPGTYLLTLLANGQRWTTKFVRY